MSDQQPGHLPGLQPDNRLFPVLGAVLYYCGIHLLGILTALYSRAAGGKNVFTGAHFIALAIAAGIIFLVFRRKLAAEKSGGPDWRFPPRLNWLCLLPLLLALGYLAASFFFSADYVFSPLSTQPAVVLLGLLYPTGICLFCRAVPPGRQGLALALCMIAGEASWIFLLPLLDIAAASPLSSSQLLYLHKLIGVILLGVGACCSAALWQVRDSGLRLPLHGFEPPERPGPADPAAPKSRPARRFMGWTAAGVLLFLILMGLETAALMPRVTMQSGERSNLHLVLLAALPLAGWLADRAGGGDTALLRRLGAAFVLTAAIAPVSTALHGPGWSDELFGLLNFLRSSAQLLLFVLLVRLAGRSSLFPFGVVCVYSLFLFILPGTLLARALAALPGARPAAGFALLLGLGLCLWRALAWLRRQPGLLAPLRDIAASPPVDAQAAGKKLAAFAAAFGLTRRESEILAGIARGLPPEAIQLELGISESTVRFHQTGLLKKTALPSRQRLASFYAAWESPRDRS